MGYISKNLKEIPSDYENYLIFLSATVPIVAQRIIDSEFIHLSKATGSKNLLVYIYDDVEKERLVELLELKEKRFPILLYTSDSPDVALRQNKFILFELGKFKDEYEVYIFLEKLCWFLKSPDANREIEWEVRKEKLLNILRAMSRFLPGFGDILDIIR